MSDQQNCLRLPHGVLNPPVFLPDATQGVVRSVDSADLETCGTQAVVMNTFHLMQRPGSSTVHALGGLHWMSGWRRPIVTDSGGFQAYSLIRQNPRYGKLSDRGITFKPDGAAREFSLTAEKTIQLQLAYGADIVICLDDCTHPDDPQAEQEESVNRTVKWARRCRQEFDRLCDQKKLEPAGRPLLFGVIQGGRSMALRRQCADQLLEIGFDGYGYGGWPLDNDGSLLIDMLAYTRELAPAHLPLHALGVGHPESVAVCARLGYPMFDSSLPTRDARRGRLYALADAASWQEASLAGKWLSLIYVGDDKHIKTDRPIMPGCDCACCSRYSMGYLHHLFEIEDSAALRLATIHNLRFMNQLMSALAAGKPGR